MNCYKLKMEEEEKYIKTKEEHIAYDKGLPFQGSTSGLPKCCDSPLACLFMTFAVPFFWCATICCCDCKDH